MPEIISPIDGEVAYEFERPNLDQALARLANAERAQQQWREVPLEARVSPKLAGLVQLEEISCQLKKLKNNKATNDLPNEIIKAGGEYMLKTIQILFNLVMKYEIIPSDWTKGTIVTIFKKVVITHA